ncbi:hypothetical protein C8R47DRAFT_1068863 [Mycena vitilis]|nr:hypothetical protein C8R47DRAFT_1068863 [Mycena vitilis]
MYLCTDALLQPRHLRNTMRNHGKLFLGNMEYHTDFHPPPAYTYAYVKKCKECHTASGMDGVIMFGEIVSIPTANDICTSVRLCPPNWTDEGWYLQEFDELFESQLDPLDTAAMEDLHNEFVANKLFADLLHDWIDKKKLVVDIWNRGRTTSCLYPDEDGQYFKFDVQRDGTGFPFVKGDTVVISAELSRVEKSSGDDSVRVSAIRECYRLGLIGAKNYHIFAKEMKKVRIAQAPWDPSDSESGASGTLGSDEEDEGDGENDADTANPSDRMTC